MARGLDVDVGANGVRFERTLKGSMGLAKSWAGSFKGAILSAFGATAITGIFRGAGNELKSLGDEASKIALPLDQFMALKDIAADSKQKVDELTGAIEALNKARTHKDGMSLLGDMGIDASTTDVSTRSQVFDDVRKLSPKEAGAKYGELFTAKQIEAIRKAGEAITYLGVEGEKYNSQAQDTIKYQQTLIELERTKLELHKELAPVLVEANKGMTAFIKYMTDMSLSGFAKRVFAVPYAIGKAATTGHDKEGITNQMKKTPTYQKYFGKKGQSEEEAIAEGQRQAAEDKAYKEELKARLEKDNEDMQAVYDMRKERDEEYKSKMAQGAFGDQDLSVDGGFLGKNLRLVSEQNVTWQEMQKKVADNTTKMVELLSKIATNKYTLSDMKSGEWQP